MNRTGFADSLHLTNAVLLLVCIVMLHVNLQSIHELAATGARTEPMVTRPPVPDLSPSEGCDWLMDATVLDVTFVPARRSRLCDGAVQANWQLKDNNGRIATYSECVRALQLERYPQVRTGTRVMAAQCSKDVILKPLPSAHL